MFDWVYNIYNSFVEFIKSFVNSFAGFFDTWFGGIIVALLSVAGYGIVWAVKRFIPGAFIVSLLGFLQGGSALFIVTWLWAIIAKAVGIGIIAYAGWDVLIPHVDTFLVSLLNALPQQVIPIVRYLGLFDAISFICSILYWAATIQAAKYIFKPSL